MGSVPLGRPEWRIDNMTESNSRYDWFVAAPSDEKLTLVWKWNSVLFGLSAMYVTVIFLGIVTNKSVRQSAFNLYLIFLTIPDAIVAWACTITCALNTSINEYWSPAACRLQSTYLVMAICTNCWCNAVVAREIFRMLRIRNTRYIQPSAQTVIRQCLSVYTFALSLGILGIVLPGVHVTRSHVGVLCVPVPKDRASEVFFWIVYIPLLFLIPTLYIVFVIVYVLWKGLLPPRGKRRTIGIFFFRISVIFGVMWTPSILTFYTFSRTNIWLVFTSAFWAHLQAMVSASMSLFKPDVGKAVYDFVTCNRKKHDDETRDEEEHGPIVQVIYTDELNQHGITFEFLDESQMT